MSFNFSKLNTPEYMQKQKEREEQEHVKEKLIKETLSFTGHRPNKLNNCYSLKHPTSIQIKESLMPTLKELIRGEGINRFITGGAIGFDQIAFWTVQSLKIEYPEIKNIVAIPFKKQPSNWHDKETLHWYERMLKVADELIYVDELVDYHVDGVSSGEYHVAKMQKRNEYMIDNSNTLIACWDGTNGGTGNCIKYATKEKRGSGMLLLQMHPKYNFDFHNRYL